MGQVPEQLDVLRLPQRPGTGPARRVTAEPSEAAWAEEDPAGAVGCGRGEEREQGGRHDAGMGEVAGGALAVRPAAPVEP